jgi:hypothetical protein
MQTDVESPMDTVVDDDVPGNPQNVLLYVNCALAETGQATATSNPNADAAAPLELEAI